MKTKRLIGEHFGPSGRAKKPLDKREAQVEAHRLGKYAYPCKFCGRWHIGGTA